MSWIRDKLRKDIQDDLIECIEIEIWDMKEPTGTATLTDTLCQATTSPDTIESLRNKFGLPLVKKKIKFL